MTIKKRFSQLFKLSPGKVQQAFSIAVRCGSIDGIRLLYATSPINNQTFIIALTKAVKGSVVRNLLRRRIKAIIHEGITENGPLPEGIFLCVVYPSAARQPYTVLSTLLKSTIWKQKNQVS